MYGNDTASADPRYLGVTESPSTIATDFGTVLDRLRSARKELGEATANAAAARDVIHGSRPENADGTCRPVRSGLLGAYEDEVDNLFDTINALHGHIASIRHGLPN